MRTLRIRKIKQSVWGQISLKWWSLNSNWGLPLSLGTLLSWFLNPRDHVMQPQRGPFLRGSVMFRLDVSISFCLILFPSFRKARLSLIFRVKSISTLSHPPLSCHWAKLCKCHHLHTSVSVPCLQWSCCSMLVSCQRLRWAGRSFREYKESRLFSRFRTALVSLTSDALALLKTS